MRISLHRFFFSDHRSFTLLMTSEAFVQDMDGTEMDDNEAQQVMVPWQETLNTLVSQDNPWRTGSDRIFFFLPPKESLHL